MLHALMPTRNEANRYVVDVIADLEWHGIPVLVCDDQSDDRTRELVAVEPNVDLVVRPDGVPSFLEHEGYFRQWCWEQLAEHGVGKGDLVLCIDADEYLAAADVHNAFLTSTLFTPSNTLCWELSVAEIWGWNEEGAPMQRVDGLWGKSRQAKLAAWPSDLTFPDRPMASGALPLSVRASMGFTPMLSLVHYGYANPDDRVAKYQRYTEHSFGHNPAHIESILTRPTLREYVER